MTRFAKNEFTGTYRRDRRTDEQRTDAYHDCVDAKLRDPNWMREWFGNTYLEAATLQLIYARDYIALGERLSAAMQKQAETEAAQEVA